MFGRKLILFACVVTSVLTSSVLAGCVASNEEVSMTRVRSYSSAEEMGKDSNLVAVVEIKGARVERDVDEVTDFTLLEAQVVKIKGNSSGGTVIIRQLGSDRQTPPVPLMKRGEKYLVFLTLSGLPGELGKQYYITGANAGLYRQESAQVSKDASKFERVVTATADRLPSSVGLEVLDLPVK